MDAVRMNGSDGFPLLLRINFERASDLRSLSNDEHRRLATHPERG
jgi:hypothetical protein